MRPPAGTGPPALKVQRQFDGNRLAQDHQARAYQQVLPAVRRSATRTGVAGPPGGPGQPALVGPEGVAA
jgi:hypothetical protein